MKSLGILAVLAVLTVGVASAQSTQDMGNMKTSGATFAEGIVDSSSTTSLSIKNESGGRLTFLLDNHTVNAANHAAGSRVKINYHTNENGVAIADEIQGSGASTKVASNDASSTGYSTATKPATAPVVTETERVAPIAPAPVAPVTTTADTKLDNTMNEPATTAPAANSLPRTASHLPALSLLGLAALAGFAVLRSVR